MAKRSDFAQKLLDDLRLRKERMATPYKEESSNQVVPYSRGQSSRQIGDLSMALAIALEHGGKLRSTEFSRNNYMLNFLHQISKGSMNFGNMEKRSSSDRFQLNYPIISHLHIKEISKGAEKLNQILKTCSNGIKFDKYSVEIGRELLKGAMDLEESLRMLLNLQEASEYAISSKSKTRITLLEDDEDEDNKKPMHEQKQLILPRFSFDKISPNSHNTQGVKRSGQKQSLPALNYLQEPSNFLDTNQALIPHNVAAHRKSANYGTTATLSEQKNNSTSKQGKVRMSNVIAKLMGIDDILEDSHSKTITQKGLNSKMGMSTSQLPGEGSTKKVESKTMEKQKLMEAEKRPVIKNPKVGPEFIKSKSLPTPITKLEEGKITRKNFNGIRSMTILAKGDNTTDSQQSSTDQSQINVTHQKLYLERGRKQKDVRQMEQKETDKGKSRGSLLKIGSQQKELHPIKISKSAFPEGSMENILQFDKRYVSNRESENQKKSLTSIELQQPQVLKKAERKEVQHNENQGENKNGKQNLQDRKQKGPEITSRNLSKPTENFLGLRKKQLDNDNPRQRKQISKEAFNVIQTDVFPNCRYQGDLARDEISYKSRGNVDALTNRSSEPSYAQKCQEAEFQKVNASVQVGTEQKQSYVLATKKAQPTRIQESEASQKIDDESTRRNGIMHNLPKPQKQENPIPQEAKAIKHETFKVSGFKEVEATVVGLNGAVTSIKQAIVPEKLSKEVKQVATSHGADSKEFQNLKKPQVTSNDKYQKTDTMVTSNPPEPMLGRDKQLSRINITSYAPTVTAKDQEHISCPQQSDHRSSFTKSRRQGALRESESCLKQILLSSELFLNIAEALFKLNIPTGILEIGICDFEDEESTVTLECSLEIMKRKGKRQEFVNHPATSISMRFMRIRSLDGLVKQLHDDFEMLKFYGRKGRNECHLEDYLPKMLENDLRHRNPDLNCMWDLGWNERMFSFIERDDVIRGVENHILSGLVDEITRDLFHI